MPMTLRHDRGTVYRIEVSGVLRKSELDECQASLVRELDRVGTVRLLFLLTDFRGWERGAAWNDLTFFVRHGSRVERLAIVGDERWRSESLMFAGADLRAAPVEYFEQQDLDRARAWLLADGPVADRTERNAS